MVEKENVARLLKKIWICDGIISSAVFNLRPQIHETYISVLRECVDTFAADVKKICKELPVNYALMDADGIMAIKCFRLKFPIKITTPNHLIPISLHLCHNFDTRFETALRHLWNSIATEKIW